MVRTRIKCLQDNSKAKKKFEQEVNDMVMVLRKKQNENARIHAELYNMQNELLSLRSVENELS